MHVVAKDTQFLHRAQTAVENLANKSMNQLTLQFLQAFLMAPNYAKLQKVTLVFTAVVQVIYLYVFKLQRTKNLSVLVMI